MEGILTINYIKLCKFCPNGGSTILIEKDTAKTLYKKADHTVELYSHFEESNISSTYEIEIDDEEYNYILLLDRL